jgi:hypothetical protein
VFTLTGRNEKRAWKDSNLQHTAPETDTRQPNLKTAFAFSLQNKDICKIRFRCIKTLTVPEPVLNLYQHSSSLLPPSL